MTQQASEIILLLRSIRGTFSEKRSSLYLHLFHTCLYGVVAPAFFTFALFQNGLPKWPFTEDQWAVLVLIPLCLCLGYFLWYNMGGEYEFTGSGIEFWRRGKMRKKIHFDDVEKLEVIEDRYGNTTLILVAQDERFPLLLYPSLKAEMARIRTGV